MLSEPKMILKVAYIKQLQTKLLNDHWLKAKLCKQFAKAHAKLARGMSASTMSHSVCCIATEKMVFCAFEIRKNSAGELLKCVRLVNSTNFPQEGFVKNL